MNVRLSVPHIQAKAEGLFDRLDVTSNQLDGLGIPAGRCMQVNVAELRACFEQLKPTDKTELKARAWEKLCVEINYLNDIARIRELVRGESTYISHAARVVE